MKAFKILLFACLILVEGCTPKLNLIPHQTIESCQELCATHGGMDTMEFGWDNGGTNTSYCRCKAGGLFAIRTKMYKLQPTD